MAVRLVQEDLLMHGAWRSLIFLGGIQKKSRRHAAQNFKWLMEIIYA